MARTFQSKGGWVTLCQNEGTYQNTMLFLSPVVGCLLKKSFKRVTGTPGFITHSSSWSLWGVLWPDPRTYAPNFFTLYDIYQYSTYPWVSNSWKQYLRPLISSLNSRKCCTDFHWVKLFVVLIIIFFSLKSPFYCGFPSINWIQKMCDYFLAILWRKP